MIKPGQTIGVAASSGAVEQKELVLKGMRIVEEWGYSLFYDEGIFSQEGYLAGNDERRAQELEDLINNPEVKLIMFARGGYGLQRILPRLIDKNFGRQATKPIIGYSDLTPLLNYAFSHWGSATYYGPTFNDLGKGVSKESLNSLKEILSTGKIKNEISLDECTILRSGFCSGQLSGGCLTLLADCLATPYAINPPTGICFFEDINEPIYRLDRKLTQLKHSGFFDQTQGILIGSMITSEGSQKEVEKMLLEIFHDFKGPIVANFPAGHQKNFITLPFGIKGRLNANDRKLGFSWEPS